MFTKISIYIIIFIIKYFNSHFNYKIYTLYNIRSIKHNIHSIGGGSALSNINAVLYSVPISKKDICNMFIIFMKCIN